MMMIKMMMLCRACAPFTYWPIVIVGLFMSPV